MDLSHKISKTMNIPKKVIDKVLEVKNADKSQSSGYIARKVSKDLGVILQEEQVKDIINMSKELVKGAKEKLKEMNDDIKEDKKYDVINNEYVIYTTVNSKEGKIKQVYRLPVELVDNIFNDFSKHGANLSGQEIMNKYELKPKVWNLIKNNIGLYKDSHILSPLSMDTAKNVEEVIEEATYKNFQDKYKNKYKEAHITNLENMVKKQAKILGTIEGFLEQIEPLLNSIKPLHIQPLKHKTTKGAIPVYHFGDTHLGKVGTDLVLQRLKTLEKDIIANPSKEIYMDCLGDLFEAIMQGGMHSGQIEGMDGIYGADLFMFAVRVFVDFLKNILKAGKKVYFIGIGGNHDRASQLNEGDNERIYATIFYEMLKSYLANANIQFKIIRDKIGSFEVDGIQYLVHHGEKLDKKNPEKIAWKFADSNKQVVIVSAHEHNEQIYTGKNVTHLKINAMAGQNQYDKDLMLDSYAGYSVTKRNEFGLPDIYSKRLP